MKKIIALTLLFLLTLGASSAYANTETEPNDTYTTANVLSQGDNYGKLSGSLDRDWWSDQVPAGSVHKVTLTSPSNYPYLITLYTLSPLGVPVYQSSASGNGSVTLNGGASGTTFFVKVTPAFLNVDTRKNYTLNLSTVN
ncbi:hypothetical protein ACFVVQ_14380 [Paenibacillus chitinolyticus]|uniref:hypothetical protein n=1 Tax=Paenibacillus chitinolyticus TaxID=79263 RepID=UPI0036DBDCCF